MDELKKELMYQPKNGYDRMDTDELLACEDYCRGYMRFLDDARTEREAVREAVKLAESAGFRPLTADFAGLKPGEKVYYVNRGKSLLLAVGGRRPLSEGCVIGAAHIDCPRLDLKQLPLYEDSELAYLRTHYYGGIKKYQWTAIPLELHGVVSLRDGSTAEISMSPMIPSSSSQTCCPTWRMTRWQRTPRSSSRGRSSALSSAVFPMPGRGRTG